MNHPSVSAIAAPRGLQKLFSTIRWRLIIGSFLAVGVPLVVFTYALSQFLRDFYLQQLERELRSKAFIVADAAAPILSPATPDDPGALSRMVAQWRLYTDVRITLMDANGIIRASPQQEEVGIVVSEERRPGLRAALAGRENSTVWKNPQFGFQDTMYANVPVRDGARIVGAARVSYTLTEIQRNITRIRSVLLGSVAVYGALILCLTVWLAGSIVRPVEGLTQGAQRLAAGDLEHRVSVKGTVEIMHLATTLNQMSERLQKLEGLRRQYVSNVSHELRTPLAAIRGMAETLMQHGESDPALRDRYLPRIVSQTERLARLASQLLDLAQIESGNLVNTMALVSLAVVVDDALGACVEAATEKGVILDLDVPSTLPDLMADRDRLVQVVVNLVDNALRYTPPGGTVAVTAAQREGYVELCVADTGQGIGAEHLPHLFERFYRVDQSRSRSAGGTGLGLAIVWQIVEAHGGSIEVASEVGRGTRFTLALPLPQEQA